MVIKFQRFIFNTLFPTSTTVYRSLIEKSRSYMSNRYPLIINETQFVLQGNVNFYLLPELYAKENHF